MIKRIHAVGIIIENNSKEILLLLRHKQDPEGETWGLVGGKVDKGEEKLQAAVREIKEEIGLELEPSELIFLRTYNWNRKDGQFLFEVFKWNIDERRVDLKLDRDENIKYLWITPKNALKREDLMLGLYEILRNY